MGQTPRPQRAREWVMVCGVGTLGIQCIRVLKGYGVRVSAIDTIAPDALADLEADHLIYGDCRRTDVLVQARIQDCRAVLLVSDSERTNVEASLAVRRLNPNTRLVVRADQQNLNDLLAKTLGNFVAFASNRLAAPAFALAALNANVLGYFELEGIEVKKSQLVQVIQRTIAQGDSWCGLPVDQVNSSSYQVLQHIPAATKTPSEPSADQGLLPLFHLWDPTERLQAGDRLVLVTAKAPNDQTHLQHPLGQSQTEVSLQPERSRLAPAYSIYQRLQQEWQRIGRTGQGILTALGFSLALVALYIAWFPGNLIEAVLAALLLLTGGNYGDLPNDGFSAALRLFSIVLTVAGTVLTGLVYAQLTNWLLTARLQFMARRPPLPQTGHVVIAGLGRLGRRVAVLLQEFRQPIVGMEVKPPEEHLLPQLPIVYTSGTSAAGLQQVTIARARSLLAATSDDLINLEIALLARSLNPSCGLVIRTSDARFSEDVAGLLPNAQVLCVPVLAAKAFAAAGLGENVLSLFQLGDRTVLVTEYRVEVGDTLCERLLSEMAYGYSVVPILHQRWSDGVGTLYPRYDRGLRLQVGDRLVLLATSTSLQNIEQGVILPRHWQLTLERPQPNVESLDVVQVLTRHLGYTLNQAQALLGNLPCVLPEPLYALQAHRLQKALERCGVRARVSDWQT